MKKAESAAPYRDWAAYVILVVAAVHVSTVASADCLDRATRFAEEVCGQIVTSGSRDNYKKSGTVDAEIGGMIRKFVGGATANAEVGSDEDAYTNVAREQLTNELANVRECRSKMAQVAIAQVCPPVLATGVRKTDIPSPFPIDWRVISDVSFERPPDGWVVGDRSRKQVPVFDLDVLEGKYRWSMEFSDAFEERMWEHWVNLPYGPQLEFYVAVDIKLVQSSGDTNIALIFGKSESTDFSFKISSKQSYSLQRYDGSTHFPVRWTSGDFNATHKNRIAVISSDGHLRLYINSEQVGEMLQPPNFVGGTFALSVSSEKLANTVVDFDNFVLRIPK